MEAQNENAEGVDLPAKLEIISRAEAKARGLKRFFTGEPCDNEHLSERSVATSACCECTIEASRKWRSKNLEKQREATRKWMQRWRAEKPDEARKYKRQFYAKNPDKQLENSRRTRAKNRDKILERKRQLYAENPDLFLERNRRQYAKNRSKHRERNLRWHAENPDWRQEYNRQWRTDPFHRIIRSQGRHISQALKGNKSKRTMEYIGCTPQFLRDHLMRLATGTNYTLENFGKVWHVDHILPVASFDLNNENDRIIAFNWSNLRPLSAKENLTKGARLPTDAELRDHYTTLVKLYGRRPFLIAERICPSITFAVDDHERLPDSVNQIL